jgi:hypothetical protein
MMPPLGAIAMEFIFCGDDVGGRFDVDTFDPPHAASARMSIRAVKRMPAA